MITTVAGADLSIANDSLRELTREYHSTEEHRFEKFINLTGITGAGMLWNPGTEGEKLLVERMILTSDVDIKFVIASAVSIAGWGEYGAGKSLLLGGIVSPIGRCYNVTPIVGATTLYYICVKAFGTVILDNSGHLIPNSNGLIIYHVGEHTSQVLFQWREID